MTDAERKQRRREYMRQYALDHPEKFRKSYAKRKEEKLAKQRARYGCKEQKKAEWTNPFAGMTPKQREDEIVRRAIERGDCYNVATLAPQ
jgi:hypothetical protein